LDQDYSGFLRRLGIDGLKDFLIFNWNILE
jgi:hypothetical protein